MANRTLIRDMNASQFVNGVYAIHNCQLGQTKGGKPYIKCILADRSGRAPGRMWNASEALFNALPTDGFVWIEGQSQPYQGQLQIIIQQIETTHPDEADLPDLLPSTDQDVEKMFAGVTELLSNLQDPGLKALTRMYLDDRDLMAQFRQAPAAMSLHHAYLGGLLEHTLNLMRLAEVFCPLYPGLNRDLVITGLFLHDLGKCAELRWRTGFAYTDQGQLVGHIGQGLLWLQRKADDSAAMGHPIPPAVLMVLQHIILSHHGRPEFGALKIPATPEAIAVSLLDNLDAKLQMAISATRPQPSDTPDAPDDHNLGGHFTEKVWALDTRLYRPDPTTLDP